MYTILGGGLSGLSVADHMAKLGIAFKLFEAKSHGGGHIHSEKVDGFTWDEGPHVSFTKHDYVKNYFAENCGQNFLEYPTSPTNYFRGNWIMHPAQSHLYAIPEPLRTEAVNDVITARKTSGGKVEPHNYHEWLQYAFGKTFAENFPEVYTKKYWTTEAINLATDWIGNRVYFPEIEDMVSSADGPLDKQTHYISKVRYPGEGGFYSYIKTVEEKLDISYNHSLEFISFDKKELYFKNGESAHYEKLVSTIPLPVLILNSDAPGEIKRSARLLKCSQLLIINVVANHPPPINNHWIYVYDKELYSTRINFTDLLATGNGIEGQCGIQVEVYFSDYQPLDISIEDIEQKVLGELVTMGLVKSAEAISSYHHKWIKWANVIFDNERKAAQNTVFNWLETKGLAREDEDLEPMTGWTEKPLTELGDIILAGRFAQWKYYWTDDCVMRGKFIADCINQDKFQSP